MPDDAYDVFISFSPADGGWVRDELLRRLRDRGLRVCRGEQDFTPGAARLVEAERAIETSRYTLLVLSPAYLAESWRAFENILTMTLANGFEQRRLIPLLRAPVTLPPRLAALVAISFAEPSEASAAWQRLLDALGVSLAEERLAALPSDVVPEVGPLPPGSRMPLSPNLLFTGREDDLRALARLLRAGETAAIGPVAAALGMGGIGKTQLASEFAHRYGRYFVGGVFWLSFADPASVPAEIAACGGPDGLDLAPDFAALPLDQQVRLVQDAWRRDLPRLLVFDNCEDEALLQQWRPTHGACRVLLTSRRASWAPTLGVQPLPLDVLPRDQSVALLRRYLAALDVSDAELSAIAQAVGDLPLALHLSGSFLARYGRAVTPAAYLAALQQPDALTHRALEGWKLDQQLNPTRHEQHVARTFALSYDQLNAADEADALALRLLARAAYFAPGEPIPRDLLIQMLDLDLDDADAVLLAEDALHRLRDLGLLDEEDDGALRLHRLLAIFVRAVTADDAAQADVEQTLLDLANHLNNVGDPRPLLVLQPHLRAATDVARERMDERAADLCNTLGFHLHMIGDYEGARPYYERALAIWEAVLGAEHPATAMSLNNLGMLLQAQGDYATARPYFERALAITEAVLGAEHLDTAMSLNSLGMLLKAQGDLTGARRYVERALAITEAVLGAEHLDTAMSLNNLGMLLQAQGDYAAARRYLERALAICEAVLGAERLVTATSLNNLGTLLQAQGDLAGARRYVERALAITEAVLGAEHPDTATSLNNLGMLLQAQGDYAAARRYVERAMVIQEAVLGPQHPLTATSLNNLGTLLKAQGDLTGARRYVERALAIREVVLGPQHPLTATSLHHLGQLLKAQGDYAAARRYVERALAIQEAVLGAEHPDTATSLNNLGLLLQAQGDYAAARRYFERALAICEAVLDPDHPTTRTVRVNLLALKISLPFARLLSWLTRRYNQR